MSYFRTQAEALHFALSSDGLSWRALNDNRPVWRASIGNKSVRDPFIVRGDNGVYHLLSTNSWTSDAILLADSDDLITWRNERLVPVMRGINNVQNAWAPECFYDFQAKVYRLIWSSSLLKPSEDAKNHGFDHRIWTCETRDFEEFSAPVVFFDPGYSVIDAQVVRFNDGFMMAFKDERGRNQPGQEYKRIKVCFADSALGPWTRETAFLTPELSEGPTLFRRDDVQLGTGGTSAAGWTMFYDLFAGERFGALHSTDGKSWTDISSRVSFPPGPRHACVLKILDSDGGHLLRHFR